MMRHAGSNHSTTHVENKRRRRTGSPCSRQRLSEIPLRFKRRLLPVLSFRVTQFTRRAALGDARAVLQLLEDTPSCAIERDGLRQWTPLYYCCSSRHGRGEGFDRGARGARVADRLLALGADPNDEIATLRRTRRVPLRAPRCGSRGSPAPSWSKYCSRAGASTLPTNGTAGPPIPLTDAVFGGNLACLERLLAARPDAWQAREALEVAIFHDRPRHGEAAGRIRRPANSRWPLVGIQRELSARRDPAAANEGAARDPAWPVMSIFPSAIGMVGLPMRWPCVLAMTSRPTVCEGEARALASSATWIA